MKQTLLLIPILTLLTGCVSTFERTETMLNEGRVDDALALIEKSRERSPNDEEYIGLERRVRLQWISDKLIQVRLARLAENKGASVELMRKILKNETSWGLIPTGAVYATHAEETAHLSTFIQSGIYESIQKKQPLAAAAKYREDRSLLEDLLKVETDRLQSAIAESGREFCTNEAKALSKNDYYAAGFLKTACAELRSRVTLPKTVNSGKLFGSLAPNIESLKIPDERVTDFTRDLKIEFEKSIWHDPAAKRSLAVNLTGAVEEKIEDRRAYRSKPYTVQIPYEEKSVRKKDRKTGLETFFEVMAWALTTYQPSREVDNGDGTVTVYETKYRSETRYFPYEVKEVTQTLSVDWKIQLAPDQKNHEFAFRDRLQTVSDEHNNSFPDAGVASETRKLVRPTDWLSSLNRKLMDRIGVEFHQAWINQFCSGTNPTLKVDEVQHRCIYGANGQAPADSSEWFRKRYGIEIETWRQLASVRK